MLHIERSAEDNAPVHAVPSAVQRFCGMSNVTVATKLMRLTRESFGSLLRRKSHETVVKCKKF